MVKRYAGISFRCSRRVYCFEVGALHLKVNDDVVVETDRGVNIGQVVVSPETATLPAGVPVESVKKVLRKAREDDFVRLQENRKRELDAANICHEKIKSYKLKMKLVRAEFTHDGNRVIFYFTAENRVDFRELVKDLAHTLHVRVEMRQIGIRDAAGMLGGVGICGRELCCASFLSNFDPVTVKMAKEQNISLTPSEITGMCGRLRCCLVYEYDQYVEARKSLPKEKKIIPTPLGEGKVISVNPLKQTVMVRLEKQGVKEFSLEELKTVNAPPPDSPKPQQLKPPGSRPKERKGRSNRKNSRRRRR